MKTLPVGTAQISHAPSPSEGKKTARDISGSSITGFSRCPNFISAIVNKLRSILSSLLTKLGFGQQAVINRLINDPVRFLRLLDPTQQVGENEGIFTRNAEGKTILFLLCEKEGEEITLENGKKILLTLEIIKRVIVQKKGVRDSTDNNGQYPLHVVKSVETAIAVLAERGDLRLTAEDKNKQIPLHRASIAGRSELVAWMLNQMPHSVYTRPYDNKESTPLHYAANVATARAFVEFNIHLTEEVTSLREYPFQTALRDKRQDVAEYLVQQMVQDENIYRALIIDIKAEDLQAGKIGEIVLRFLGPLNEQGIAYRKILARKVEGVDRNSPFGKLLITSGVIE